MEKRGETTHVEVPSEPLKDGQIAPFFPRLSVMRVIDTPPELRKPLPGELEMEIHPERIDEVLDTLMWAYETKQYPYNLGSTRVPQDPRHMPESLLRDNPENIRGTKEHAMFWWSVCYWMRGGSVSIDVVPRIARIFDDHPELFNCESILETTPQEIAPILKSYGLGMHIDNAKSWHINASRLLEHYEGDPRKIFEDTHDWEVVYERIMNDGKGGGFYGFQEKMASMIAYYLMDEDIIEYQPYPLPIDLHVSRVSLETKMVTFPNAPFKTDLIHKKFLDTLRSVYFDYAERRGIDWRVLCNAVWLLSQTLCGTAPGNQTKMVEGIGQGSGRSTAMEPIPVDIYDVGQQERYERTCRNCPVEHFCEFNVPGGNMYYVIGALMIRKVREKFPELPSSPPTGVELF